MRRRINTTPDEKRAQDHPNLDRAAVSVVTRVSVRNMDSGSEPPCRDAHDRAVRASEVSHSRREGRTA